MNLITRPLEPEVIVRLLTMTPLLKQTLFFMAQGLNPKQIARRLNHPNTSRAQDHITRILQHLKVKTRVEAAVIAAKAGIV